MESTIWALWVLLEISFMLDRRVAHSFLLFCFPFDLAVHIPSEMPTLSWFGLELHACMALVRIDAA